MGREKLIQARQGTQEDFNLANNAWLRGEFAYVYDRDILKLARADGLKNDIQFTDLVSVLRARAAASTFNTPGGAFSVRFIPISDTTFTANLQTQISGFNRGVSHVLTGGGRSQGSTHAVVDPDTNLLITYAGLALSSEYTLRAWSAVSFQQNQVGPLSLFQTTHNSFVTGFSGLPEGFHTLDAPNFSNNPNQSMFAGTGMCLDFSATNDLQVFKTTVGFQFLDVSGCPLTDLEFAAVDWNHFFTGLQPNLTRLHQTFGLVFDGETPSLGVCNLSHLTSLSDVFIRRCDKLIISGLHLDSLNLNWFDTEAVGTVIKPGGLATLLQWTITGLESFFADLAPGTGSINVTGPAVSDETWATVKAIATGKGYTVIDGL